MVRVAPIKLQYNPKTLWFDPKELTIHKGDAVVVTTARGTEFGYAVDNIFEAAEADIKKLKAELKPVKRLASTQDVEKAREMQKRSDEALPIFKEIATEASKDMHPVSVEFLLEGDKAIFNFEAEDRVDFRELVRKLAAQFHVRIDMRQIGVRDEARIVGGLGHCGQELCCKRLGGEFCPVSIRMAKEQDLSLNPQKISGVCGRLMCCLRYEFDAYKDFKDRAPKINAIIETPAGPAKVVDLNVPREIITIQLPDEKRIKIPLDAMARTDAGSRPNKVTQESFDAYANQDPYATLSSLSLSSFSDTPLFSGTDTLAKNERSDAKRQERGSVKEKSRKPRRRTKLSKEGEMQTEKADTEQKVLRSQKKRFDQRGRKLGGAQTKHEGGQRGKGQSRKRSGQKPDPQGQASQKQNQNSQQGQAMTHNTGQKKTGPRPGQRSSGLRRSQNQTRNNTAQKSFGGSDGNFKDSGGLGGVRRSRRRSHKTGSSDSGTTGAAE